MASLGTITIPDNTLWIDRDNWTGVAVYQARARTGDLIIQQSQKTGGRPVTLNLGWIDKATLTQIETLRDNPLTTNFTISLPSGVTMTCDFATEDIPNEIEPVQVLNAYEDEDLFNVIVKLIEVTA